MARSPRGLVDSAVEVMDLLWPVATTSGAFTLDVKSVLSENLGGILGGTQC